VSKGAAEKDDKSEKRGGMVKGSAFEETDPKVADTDDDDGDTSDEGMKRKAGKDVLEAHKSGDPLRVFHAHQHLMNVHGLLEDKEPTSTIDIDTEEPTSLAKRIKSARG
jgi:hypothetical protein